MTQFLSNPKFQALDISGEPLSGGLLYSYEPGTTTNKATYPTIADAVAKTNANTNPVVLDSRGEASVVLGGNTKLILKDSDENIIWTLDNVDSRGTILDNNGNEILGFSTVANATNYVKIENATTGNNPKVIAEGSDTNIGLDLQTKGTGSVNFEDSAGNEIVSLTGGVSGAVNQIMIVHAASGDLPQISAAGDDTNIGVLLIPKNAGRVEIADGTDSTKRVAHNLSGTTSGFTTTFTYNATDNRTIVFPDASDTLIGKDTVDVVNNKTLVSPAINTAITGSAVLDEDDMASNSDIKIATQQSIKAYVDNSLDYTLITSASAADVSVVDLTGLTSAYNSYVVVITNLFPAVDSTDLYMRYSTDGGSTYFTTGYFWSRVDQSSSSATLANSESSSDSKIDILANAGNASNERSHAVIQIFNPSSTTPTHVVFDSSYYRSTGAAARTTGAGGNSDNSNDTNALRFFMSTGNISTGLFRLYGRRA